MPNYLYNGVEGPALPEWDKTTCPYAVICDTTGWGGRRLQLVIAEKPLYIVGGSTPLLFNVVDNEVFCSQSFFENEPANVWRDFDKAGGSYGAYWSNPVWANYDVEYCGNNGEPLGTIALPASDPVPVGGTTSEWVKQDAYLRKTEWDGHEFYKRVGDQWVKQDAFVMTSVAYPVPIPDGCLTFSSAEPFTVGVKTATKSWDGTLEYSTDTITWSEWNGTTAVASAEHGTEHRIYMRGSGNSVVTNGQVWNISGSNVRCDGNIENLLDYETVSNGEHPVMAANCYKQMFSNCTALISAPELPAMTMADSCYNAMFLGTSLVEAPDLPATKLAFDCYNGMFMNCKSLKTATKLPATELEEYCYGNLFRYCTSLIELPELPAIYLKNNCYGYMFEGCTNIKISETKSDEYPNEYRIPTSGKGQPPNNNWNEIYHIFRNTGGSHTNGTYIDHTYYTSNTVV